MTLKAVTSTRKYHQPTPTLLHPPPEY